jgi:hypothetical protein
MWYVGRGIEEVERMRGCIRKLSGIWKLLFLESDGRNGKRCTYLVCDFNGVWLKDLSPLYYIVIVLDVEAEIGHVR